MTEYKRSKSGAKKASRELRQGDTVYVIADVSPNAGTFEDPQVLHRYTVTGTHPLLGGAMAGGQAISEIVLREGPLYTERPRGIRGIWEPARQVAGPLPEGEEFDRPLTAKEIRDLEKKVAASLKDRHSPNRAERLAKEIVAARLAA